MRHDLHVDVLQTAGCDPKVGHRKYLACRKNSSHNWKIKIAEVDRVRNLSNQKQGQLIDLASDERLNSVFEQNSSTKNWISAERPNSYFVPLDFIWSVNVGRALHAKITFWVTGENDCWPLLYVSVLTQRLFENEILTPSK